MEQITDVRDSALRERVLRQLAFTRDFNGKDVCVRAEHGRVTLTGSVSSYPEKMAAAEAAKRLFGVRSIENNLIVRHAPSVSDADLQKALNGALLARGASPAVTAHATDGRVVLEGTVDWMFERTAAEVAVAYLPGVRSVDNRIRLTPTEAAGRLLEQIDQALLRTAGLDWKRIVVEVDRGMVKLTGSVFSIMEREEAERAVWAVPGVIDVDNQLDVTSRRWW